MLLPYSVRDLERGRVLRPGAAPIIDAGRADARVAQPLLDLGDVGLVLQRVGRGRGAQRVRPHVLAANAHLGHVAHYDIGVHATRRQGAGQCPCLRRTDTPEQRRVCFLTMAAGGQVFGHQAQRVRVRGQVAQLAALALHAQMRNALPFLAKIQNPQLGQLLAAQRVVQQHRQNGPVAFSFQCVVWRRVEQRARLRVAERRRPAFAGFDLRALDAPDRVVGDGVGLAQVVI